MFKIRNTETGEFFSPGHGPKWGKYGKFYRTLRHAKSAFKQILDQHHLNRAQLEIIEYEIVEK